VPTRRLLVLNEFEVAYAMEAVRKLPGGAYTVRQLFGDRWPVDHRPRRYGRRFKAAVIGGALPGVRWAGVKSNRSQVFDPVNSDG
jgi:hypothetical protein